MSRQCILLLVSLCRFATSGGQSSSPPGSSSDAVFGVEGSRVRIIAALLYEVTFSRKQPFSSTVKMPSPGRRETLQTTCIASPLFSAPYSNSSAGAARSSILHCCGPMPTSLRSCIFPLAKHTPSFYCVLYTTTLGCFVAEVPPANTLWYLCLPHMLFLDFHLVRPCYLSVGQTAIKRADDKAERPSITQATGAVAAIVYSQSSVTCGEEPASMCALCRSQELHTCSTR